MLQLPVQVWQWADQVLPHDMQLGAVRASHTTTAVRATQRLECKRAARGLELTQTISELGSPSRGTNKITESPVGAKLGWGRDHR